MAVYIRGMEMPLNCTRCACSDDDSRYCRVADEYIPMLGKPKFCPLVEIKEPHGNLIDKDAFLKYFHIEGTVIGKENAIMMQNMLNETLQAVADSPTVIERSENDKI